MTTHTNIRSFRSSNGWRDRRFISFLTRWVATVTAQREREAARIALRPLNDRELKDIGVYRCQIADGLAEIARARARLQRAHMPR